MYRYTHEHYRHTHIHHPQRRAWEFSIAHILPPPPSLLLFLLSVTCPARDLHVLQFLAADKAFKTELPLHAIVVRITRSLVSSVFVGGRLRHAWSIEWDFFFTPPHPNNDVTRPNENTSQSHRTHITSQPLSCMRVNEYDKLTVFSIFSFFFTPIPLPLIPFCVCICLSFNRADYNYLLSKCLLSVYLLAGWLWYVSIFMSPVSN